MGDLAPLEFDLALAVAVAAAAVAGWGIWPPLGLRSKKRFSDGLEHSRSKVSGTWAETESVHINCSRSIFSFMPNNYKSGWLVRFEAWEFFPALKQISFGDRLLVGVILEIAFVHSKWAETLFK